MIELKDFVRETLTQIVDGMTEFGEKNAETGWSPVPTMNSQVTAATGFISHVSADGQQRSTVMPIEFDIAITSEEEDQAGGKVGIKVLSLVDIAGGGEMKSINTSVSRVSFKIPLKMPSEDIPPTKWPAISSGGNTGVL